MSESETESDDRWPIVKILDGKDARWCPSCGYSRRECTLFMMKSEPQGLPCCDECDHPAWERIGERRVDMLHRLHAGGVRIVTGIDAGVGPWVAHGNLPRGVSQLEDAGFSPAEALATATSEAARVCGLKHRKGLLRKGYHADLIVVDGDLQNDLSALQRVRLVVLAGKSVS